MRLRILTLASALALVVVAGAALAQQAVSIGISVKNHRFQPAEISAPANVPIVLRVKNLDPTPMEFESVSLRVEKVVLATARASCACGRCSRVVTTSSTISTGRPTAR